MAKKNATKKNDAETTTTAPAKKRTKKAPAAPAVELARCPDCQEPAHAGEAAECGRCPKCAITHYGSIQLPCGECGAAVEVTEYKGVDAQVRCTEHAERAPTPPATNSEATLTAVGVGYIAELTRAGKSETTVFSYRHDLMVAIEELGGDTCVGDLTPERVLEYFACDRVMKTRTGKPKSQLSIDKTRRVFRQALTWAKDAGYISTVPLPEMAATH